ncbi:MAG: BLUF domain-containing protein [Janthinobacterium lividum]
MDTTPHLQESRRRRAVAMAVGLTANTPLAPKRYERQLLGRYQTGELTIDDVLARLASSTYHVLYRSRATQSPTETDLQALLEQSRTYNAAQQITGLLLYSDGQFVQVVEGPEAEVRSLYARIQADPRHTQVVTVSDGPGPQRWFGDWHMAFGYVDAPEVYQLLGAVENQTLPLVPLVDPHLQTLLHAFGLPEADLG